MYSSQDCEMKWNLFTTIELWCTGCLPVLLCFRFFWPPADHRAVLRTKILTGGRGKTHENVKIFFITKQQHVIPPSTWGLNTTALIVWLLWFFLCKAKCTVSCMTFSPFLISRTITCQHGCCLELKNRKSESGKGLLLLWSLPEKDSHSSLHMKIRW